MKNSFFDKLKSVKELISGTGAKLSIDDVVVSFTISKGNDDNSPSVLFSYNSASSSVTVEEIYNSDHFFAHRKSFSVSDPKFESNLSNFIYKIFGDFDN